MDLTLLNTSLGFMSTLWSRVVQICFYFEVRLFISINHFP